MGLSFICSSLSCTRQILISSSSAPGLVLRGANDRGGVIEIQPPLGSLSLALLQLGCGDRHVCRVSSAGDVHIIQLNKVYYFTQLPTKNMTMLKAESGCGTVFICGVDGELVVTILARRRIYAGAKCS